MAHNHPPGSADSPLPAGTPDALLAQATAGNLFALFRAMAAALPGGELHLEPGLSLHHTFPTNPMFKGAWAARLAPSAADAAIETAIAWFRSRNAPYFFFWTDPASTPEDIGPRLEMRGLISMEEQQKQLASGIIQKSSGAPCMIADLDRMNERSSDGLPEGFRLEEIRDEPALQTFRRLFVAIYGIPDWAGQAWVDATLAIGLGRTPWKMYLGLLDGEPVATTILFCGGGVASVYGVGALEKVRGHGIGGAVTLLPLMEARTMGYKHAALFSTELGIHAYERIGFRETPARINRYLWRRSS